jgi:hypothetical protein
VTSSVVVGEHELVIELLARLHFERSSGFHQACFRQWQWFLAVPFVRAGIVVVGGVATQAVRPAVSPVGSDVASLGAGALGGLGRQCLGGRRG